MRLKNHILTLAILVLPLTTLAQRNGNHWVFGDSVWLEFVDTGIVQRKANVSTFEGASSINIKGTNNLLFYGTPNTIYDVNENVVVNGLYGHESATQGALFIRHPDNDSVIHYFTSDKINPNLRMGLYHHTFDPDGKVLHLNDTLLYRKTEQLSSVNHRNNKDVWIVAHKVLSDSFCFFLIQKDGVLDCPVILTSGNSYTSSWAEGAILKFSPNGKFIAGSLVYGNKCEIYRFNNEIGTIFHPIIIDNVSVDHGIAFSPNSKYIYTTTSALLQYDLSFFDKTQIEKSKIQLSPFKSSTGYLQLAPNGKIYLTNVDSSYLGVVNYPDLDDSSCQFVENGLKLQYGKAILGLPSFNQSHFYFPPVEFSYRENCHTLNYEFEAKDTFNATAFSWSFTTPDSTVTSSKSGQSVYYQFSDTGKWTVQLIASNGTQTDTVAKTITIRPAWKPDFLGNDTVYCEKDWESVTLEVPKDMHCIHWMGDPSYGQPDTFVIGNPGTYFVKVTNKTFCTAYDTITIRKVPDPDVPTIKRIGDTLVSDLDSVRYQWFRDDNIQTGDTFKNFIIHTKGTYFLSVYKEPGCSAVSNSIVVDYLGLNDLGKHQIYIYPNPTDGTFMISGLTENALSIEVFDHKGALVAQLDPNDDIHDIATLQGGFYFVRVLTNEGLYQARLVIY